jgi:hypothetical protein
MTITKEDYEELKNKLGHPPTNAEILAAGADDDEVKSDLSDAEISANEGDFSLEEVAAMLNSRTPAMQALLTANPDDDDEA